MTESEAKTRWCPMVRLYGDDWTTRLDDNELKAVTDGDVARSTKCIGSACMMWRWLPSPSLKAGSPTSGYCGLAGKP